MTVGAQRLRRALEETGALREGHFRLSSGRHAGQYVQCALLLEHPARAREIGALLAARLEPHAAECVVAPALGGLIIGCQVAAALDLPFRFTERVGSEMALRRGFSFQPGERTVIVEDVVTTGRSTMETVDLVRAAGARVIALGSIIDRTEDGPFDLPYEALIRLEMESFGAEDCPLCRAGVEITAPGSRPDPI